MNEDWLAGFIDGEGCFLLRVYKRVGAYKVDHSVGPSFRLSIVDSTKVMEKIYRKLNDLGITGSFKENIKYRGWTKNAQPQSFIIIQGVPSCKRLYDVFYPRLIVKKEEVFCWGKIVELCMKGENTNPYGVLEIMYWTEKMRKNRSIRVKRKYTLDYMKKYFAEHNML